VHALRWTAHAAVLLVGVAVVVMTLGSALRTVVLPRAIPAVLTRMVFLAMRSIFRLRLGTAPSYERRDHVMAPYAPLSLLALLQVWLTLVWLGFGAINWGSARLTPWRALVESGSSLLTLGFAVPTTPALTVITFVEASIGLALLALLITYLPSLYAAFSRREALVTKLSVRAGIPPTGSELLGRAWALERFDLLRAVWESWEDWFVDVEETHTSFPALAFFRSPQADHSWVTAAGAVLDGASLRAAVVDGPRDIDAELAIRAGYLALRRIAAFYSLPYPEDPAPDDPVNITRDEFDDTLDRLASAGVPLVADRDQAWRDFAGWRVNYDAVLLELAALTMAPWAPWSSDRSSTALPRIPPFRRRPRLPIGPR
jgi:hypothetical protein